jgi:hypothetical protein
MSCAVFADGELEEALGQLARAGHKVRVLRQRKDWGKELHRAEERERLAREAVARIRRRRISSEEAYWFAADGHFGQVVLVSRQSQPDSPGRS